MRIKELVELWENNAKHSLTEETYGVHLTIEDAAKLEALSDMYPQRTKEQLLSELVSAALLELESSFPYIAGEEIATHDEFGDPIYKDTGHSPRFQELTRHYLAHQQSAKQ